MSGVLLWVVKPIENANSLLSLMPRTGDNSSKRSKFYSRISFSPRIVAYSGGAVAHPPRTSEEKVYEVVLKQAALVREERKPKDEGLEFDEKIEGSEGLSNWDLLNEAYDRCGEVCAEYAKTFYLGEDGKDKAWKHTKKTEGEKYFRCQFNVLSIIWQLGFPYRWRY